MTRPPHYRYLVSLQGNRNLALDFDGLNQTWFRDLTDADTFAVKEAKRLNVTMYVHEVAVQTISQHIPKTEIISSTIEA